MTPAAAISALTGQYVQANGLNMYYEEYGNGQPLILLHGGTLTLSMWRPHIQFLAEHFRVFTPDSRGHGKTNNPTGTLSYRLMADDVAAFVQALSLTNPFVCGYSDGGQIALEIGMRYPNLPAGLVASGVSYKFSDTYLNSLKSFGIEGPGIVNLNKLREALGDRVEDLKIEHARADDPEYWQTLIKQISTMWWTPFDYKVEDFRKISTPALILLGDRDELNPIEQSVEMYQLIPNAELAILPNTTHATTITGLSMNLVLDFLVRHRADQSPN